MTQAANLAALGTNAGTTGILPAAGGGTATPAGVTGFKNRIINGSMVIDQRNSGASITPTAGQFSVDRWMNATNVSSKYSTQQVADAPAGFTYSLKATSLSAYTIGAGEVAGFRQYIEGYNIADLDEGTANAKSFTLSFWVKSSLTGTFGGVVSNDSDRTWAFTYTISAANTWEQKTVSITGQTSGTWAVTTQVGMAVVFSLACGSSYLTTPAQWNSNNSYGATGQGSVLATNGATWQVTGVQLEVGTTATNFDVRSIGTELNLCLRYCVSYVSGNGEAMGMCSTWTTTSFWCTGRAPLPMRTAPTGTVSTATGAYSFYFAGSQFLNDTLDFTWTSNGNANNQGFLLFRSSGWSGSTSAGLAGGAQTNAAGAKIILSAEL